MLKLLKTKSQSLNPGLELHVSTDAPLNRAVPASVFFKFGDS